MVAMNYFDSNKTNLTYLFLKYIQNYTALTHIKTVWMDTNKLNQGKGDEKSKTFLLKINTMYVNRKLKKGW